MTTKLLSETLAVLAFITVLALCILCFITKDMGTLKDVAFMLLGGLGVSKGSQILSENETSTTK